MKLNTMLTLSCAAVLAVAANTFAADPATSDPGVKAREENQQDRIAQGIRSGELTPHEAQLLEKKEARLHRLEHRLKSDGTLTKADRERLQHQLDKLSAEIYALKHNDRTVPPAK